MTFAKTSLAVTLPFDWLGRETQLSVIPENKVAHNHSSCQWVAQYSPNVTLPSAHLSHLRYSLSILVTTSLRFCLFVWTYWYIRMMSHIIAMTNATVNTMLVICVWFCKKKIRMEVTLLPSFPTLDLTKVCNLLCLVALCGFIMVISFSVCYVYDTSTRLLRWIGVFQPL